MRSFLVKDVMKMSQYVITDGFRFIYRNHSGKYVPVANEVMADVYSKKQVEIIFNNQLPKALRKAFRVERRDKPPDNVKQVNDRDLVNNTEKVMLSSNIQLWLDKVENMNGIVDEASRRKEVLLQQLSDIDKELSDVMHYIEFSRLNAAQGYKAYKMIKERRMRRRNIKNELIVVEIIIGKRFSNLASEEITKAVEKLDKRTYEPRVLKELFDL